MPTPRRKQHALERQRARTRVTALLCLTVALFGAVGVRLVHLQVIARDDLAEQALDQRLVSFTIPAARGTIFDRNGRDLALDVPREFVFVDPLLVLERYHDTYLDNLSAVLGVEAGDLSPRLERAQNDDGEDIRYRQLWPDPLTPEQANAIRTLRLPGVALETRTVRMYPNGAMAAPILGAAHAEVEGLEGHAGFEHTYDDLLTGTAGRAEFERDAENREIPHSRRDRTSARRGADLVLTLDASIQAYVERTLVDQVTAQRARGGSALIIDVHTGDILAMANVTAPDMTGYAQLAGPTDKNVATGAVFEPGSTNKVITIATALDSGECDLTPESGFTVPWRIINGDSTIKDNSQHRDAWWSTREILAKSSNVGTALIADRCFTPDSMYAAMKNFGYGRETNLGLGEPNGLLTPPDEYYTTGLKSTAIGYGVAATPLQVLDVFAAIANGGRSVVPRLVTATIAPDGVRTELEVAPGRKVVSEATATTMAEMLLGVVAEGTAPCAAIPGYEVAGKTGTSRKLGADGRYVSGLTMASFVGFAPALRPELAAIVVLDEPVDIVGGAASAPVFADIMRFSLARLGIAPTPPTTNPTQWDAAAAKLGDDGAEQCRVPHGAEVDAIAAAHAGQARASVETELAPTTPAAAQDFAIDAFEQLRAATVEPAATEETTRSEDP